jgi:hypothetical protein
MNRGVRHGAFRSCERGPAGWRTASHDGRGPPARRPGLRMAGGSAHHLAQRRHRRAEHAGRGPLCAGVRLRDLRWHRRDRWHPGDRWLWPGGAVMRDLRWHRRDRWLWRGGAVRRWARPGGGRARIRVGCGWFGHGVFPWYVGSAAAFSAIAGIHRVTAARPGSWPGSFRHRHGQPGGGIASVMGTSDRDDRADAHELLR